MRLDKWLRCRLCKWAGVLFAGTLFSCTAETMKVETGAAVAAGYGLRTDLSPIQNVLTSDGAMQLLFTLQNLSDKTVKVLPWGTPLEDNLSADVFQVTFAGNVLEYQGRMVKRVAPKASDYLSLAAGEFLQQTVDISSAYDVSGIGSYRVLFAPPGGAGNYVIDGQKVYVPSEPVVIDRR